MKILNYNFPALNLVTWTLEHNKTKLHIHPNGLIQLEGSAADAAKAIFLYIIEMKEIEQPHCKVTYYSKNGLELICDHKLEINMELCLGQINYQPIFLEVKKEFDRIKNLMVFW